LALGGFVSLNHIRVFVGLGITFLFLPITLEETSAIYVVLKSLTEKLFSHTPVGSQEMKSIQFYK
jgi:hypothetical protein